MSASRNASAQGAAVTRMARTHRPSRVRRVFGVKMEGPFVPGQLAQARSRSAGYEHVRWQAVVQKIEPRVSSALPGIRTHRSRWTIEGDPHAGGVPAAEDRRGTLLLLTESASTKCREPPRGGIPYE